jgi:hypothetical protein
MDKITPEILAEIKTWFSAYTREFHTEDSELKAAVTIKEEHTRRVVFEILGIANSLNLSSEQCYLAEIIALLHDIGRFEQYARYKTFYDGSSVNHAQLGGEIIVREGILRRRLPQLEDFIVSIVAHHNAASLEKSGDDTYDFFLKLLRDADKIDILHVVTDYYTHKNSSQGNAIELGLPDTPGISQKVIDDIASQKIVHFEHMNNLNDFKVLQMGWIFDINFPHTFHTIAERKYLEKIHLSLKGENQADGIFNITKGFLEKKLGES